MTINNIYENEIKLRQTEIEFELNPLTLIKFFNISKIFKSTLSILGLPKLNDDHVFINFDYKNFNYEIYISENNYCSITRNYYIKR